MPTKSKFTHAQLDLKVSIAARHIENLGVNLKTFKEFKRWFDPKQLMELFRIDIHVAYTILLRGWGIAAGGLTVLMIPYGLTATEQGYYYTFASILALQVFFELGLNQVIVTLISHEAAHLQFVGDGRIIGDLKRADRLNGLIELIRCWYTVAAVLFFLLVSICGWIFFNHRSFEMDLMQWAPAWCLLVALTSVNLYLSPRLAVIEGTGAVANVARLRFVQSIVGNMLLWAMLLNGAGLWSTVATPCTSAIITSLWLNKKAKWLSLARTNEKLSWYLEVFPLQWRIGISWMSGFILFQLFIPTVFSIHGPVEAGRLGLSISIFNAITGLGMSWVAARSPQFTMHISRGESIALNQLFKRSAAQATLFTATVSLLVVFVVHILQEVSPHTASRILNPSILIWVALGSILNTFIFAAATYMRAFREEPMLLPSITGAFVTFFSIYITKHSIEVMMMTNALLAAFIGTPWTLFLLKRYLVRGDFQ